MAEIVKSVLPFSTLSKDRTEPFTDDMEKAAIYCLAELERSKGGGLIVKKPEEKLVFVSKFYYPILTVPWENLTLIFDGLKTTSHSLRYKIVPSVEGFMENARRSSKSLETYQSFLTDNSGYFQASGSERTITIDALLTDPKTLSELSLALPTAKPVETKTLETALLPMAIDESATSTSTQELEDLKMNFAKEISTLYNSMKFLNKTTRNFTNILRDKIQKVKTEFSEEIKKQEAIVAPKVNHINEEYDEQVTQLTKTYQKQLLPIRKEKAKFERTRQQLLDKIERCKAEAKAHAARNDTVGERKWKEKSDESKKELAGIESLLRESEKKLKEMEESNTLEAFKLRSEWENRIKESRKDILELEALRDAKVQVHEQEIQKLEVLTTGINQQIDSVIKTREADLEKFRTLGIQQTSRTKALVCVPFYLACYQADLKRYAVFPPSVVSGVGLTAKIKSVLGKTKIKQAFTSRFESLNQHLYSLPLLLDQNAVLAREVNEAGLDADIVQLSSRESIRSGLKKLNQDGRLSDKELEIFTKTLK
jgi:hypothetical protein